MIKSIKLKNINNYINYLKEKCLIIKKEDEWRFSIYLSNYGYETIINDYKHPFMKDYKKGEFIYGTNCICLIELFNFDRHISNFVLKNILNIERRLSNAVSILIEEEIIIKKQLIVDSNKKLDNYDGCIFEEDINLFNSIFEKHDAKQKRLIKQLFDYIINSEIKEKFNLSIKDFIKLSNIQINYCIFNKIFKIDNLDIPIKQTIFYDFLKIKEEWNEFLRKKFSEYSFSELKKLMTKDVNLNLISEYKTVNKIPLKALSKKWSIGLLIKIFESLSTSIKQNVIHYIFENNNFEMSNNFIPEFIEIMRMFKELRNKICHNESIYNFELTNDRSQWVISFLNNNFFNFNKKTQNANLFIAIECLMLFDKYKTKSKNKKTLRDIINSLYEEFDKKYWVKNQKYIWNQKSELIYKIKNLNIYNNDRIQSSLGWLTPNQYKEFYLD